MNEEDTDIHVLLAAAREREDIVRKYDKGNDGTADPWEDPAFEVYHKQDRYGFIHDGRLPRERDEVEKKQLEVEVSRADKWVKMNRIWPKMIKDKSQREKLTRRVYKGIPHRMRGEIWHKLLYIEDMKKTHVGLYDDMKRKARLCSPDIRQIDLDVNRTYRNHIMFRQRYGIKQQELFHVLAAYSMYNTEVGYCQGMSGVTALLLMYLTEEDAFWGLSQLLTDRFHNMHGFYIPGFPKLFRYQDHFADNVLKKFLPKVHKYLNVNAIPSSLYAIKWFMQCFLDRTPFTLSLRLWDIFICEGEKMMIPMAFNIFKLHKRALLKMPMERCVRFLQEDLEHSFGFEDDAIIESLKGCMEDLRRAKMDLPPRPIVNNEQPTLAFGMKTYPTKQDILQKLEVNKERSKVISQVYLPPDQIVAQIRESTYTNGAAPGLDSDSSQYDNLTPDNLTLSRVPPQGGITPQYSSYGRYRGGQGLDGISTATSMTDTESERFETFESELERSLEMLDRVVSMDEGGNYHFSNEVDENFDMSAAEGGENLSFYSPPSLSLERNSTANVNLAERRGKPTLDSLKKSKGLDRTAVLSDNENDAESAGMTTPRAMEFPEGFVVDEGWAGGVERRTGWAGSGSKATTHAAQSFVSASKITMSESGTQQQQQASVGESESDHRQQQRQRIISVGDPVGSSASRDYDEVFVGDEPPTPPPHGIIRSSLSHQLPSTPPTAQPRVVPPSALHIGISSPGKGRAPAPPPHGVPVSPHSVAFRASVQFPSNGVTLQSTDGWGESSTDMDRRQAVEGLDRDLTLGAPSLSVPPPPSHDPSPSPPPIYTGDKAFNLYTNTETSVGGYRGIVGGDTYDIPPLSSPESPIPSPLHSDSECVHYMNDSTVTTVDTTEAMIDFTNHSPISSPVLEYVNESSIHPSVYLHRQSPPSPTPIPASPPPNSSPIPWSNPPASPAHLQPLFEPTTLDPEVVSVNQPIKPRICQPLTSYKSFPVAPVPAMRVDLRSAVSSSHQSNGGKRHTTGAENHDINGRGISPSRNSPGYDPYDDLLSCYTSGSKSEIELVAPVASDSTDGIRENRARVLRPDINHPKYALIRATSAGKLSQNTAMAPSSTSLTVSSRSEGGEKDGMRLGSAIEEERMVAGSSGQMSGNSFVPPHSFSSGSTTSPSAATPVSFV